MLYCRVVPENQWQQERQQQLVHQEKLQLENKSLVAEIVELRSQLDEQLQVTHTAQLDAAHVTPTPRFIYEQMMEFKTCLLHSYFR